jgi:Leucine-rich repeat (LRR) protein
MTKGNSPLLFAAVLASVALVSAAVAITVTRSLEREARPSRLSDHPGPQVDQRAEELVAGLRGRVAELEKRLDALVAESRSAHAALEGAAQAAPAEADPEPSVSTPGLSAATSWLRGILPGKFAGLTPEEALFLRELDLRGMEIADADLEHLASLPNLRHLTLRGTGVTDEGLAHLGGLDQLQHLELRGTKVTGSAFEHLPRGLESLDLTDTLVTEETLRRLPVLSSLTTLDLNRLALRDSACEVLGRLPALRHVELDGTGISDDGLRRLLDLHPGLERVELRGTATTDAVVGELAAAHPGLTIVRETPPFGPR